MLHAYTTTTPPPHHQAYDFLIAVAEPVCRPDSVHEYVLTPHSLYAAVSVGLDTDTIIAVLDRLSKVHLTADLKRFVRTCTRNYGKVCVCVLVCMDVVGNGHPVVGVLGICTAV